MPADDVEGRIVEHWLSAATASESRDLIGSVVDDGNDEWKVADVSDQYLVLQQLDSKGLHPTGRQKRLPFNALQGPRMTVWLPDHCPNLLSAIMSRRSPQQVREDEAAAVLNGRNYPTIDVLSGQDKILIAEILANWFDKNMHPGEQGLAVFTEAAKRTPSSARFAAKMLEMWLNDAMVKNLPVQFGYRARLSTIYRETGQMKEAFRVTDIVDRADVRNVPIATVCVLCTTRAAAFLDAFENGGSSSYLDAAESLLKRAYGLSGGGNEYQKNAFARLNALRRTVRGADPIRIGAC